MKTILKPFRRRSSTKSITAVTEKDSDAWKDAKDPNGINDSNTSKEKGNEQEELKAPFSAQERITEKGNTSDMNINDDKDYLDEPEIGMLRDLLSRKSSVEGNQPFTVATLDQENNGVIAEAKLFVEKNKDIEMKSLLKLKELLFNYKKRSKEKIKFIRVEKDEKQSEFFPFRKLVPDHIQPLEVSESNEIMEHLEKDPVDPLTTTNLQATTGDLILDDIFLLQCLRARSYSVEEALCVCLNFYDFRKSAGWSLEGINCADLIIPLKSNVHWVLPGYDYNHRRIVVLNARYLDTQKSSIEKYQRMGQYLVEVLVNKDISTHFKGVTFVVDVHGLPYRTLLSGIGVADIKRGTGMWRDAFPCKLKSILILGLNGFSRNIVNLCLKVASKKVQDRVKCLQTYDDLKKYIPQENLPLALHGTNETFSWEEYLSEFLVLKGYD